MDSYHNLHSIRQLIKIYVRFHISLHIIAHSWTWICRLYYQTVNVSLQCPYSYGVIHTPRIQLVPNHSEALHPISMPLQSGDMLMRVSIPYSYGFILTPRIQLVPNHSEAKHTISMPLQSGEMHSWWCSKKLFKPLPQKGWLCTPVMISEYFNQAE